MLRSSAPPSQAHPGTARGRAGWSPEAARRRRNAHGSERSGAGPKADPAKQVPIRQSERNPFHARAWYRSRATAPRPASWARA